MSSNLRLYNSDDVCKDGYPFAWHNEHWHDDRRYPPIKDMIRELNGHRCERCGHPYKKGNPAISAGGQWSPCDAECTHGGPGRTIEVLAKSPPIYRPSDDIPIIEAQWRILTVHHLNGIKWDCRWWNLAALCQRCHLTVQGRVVMERVWVWEHTEWFKPHAAGWYAFDYLGEELTREETMERMEELLALERGGEIGPC